MNQSAYSINQGKTQSINIGSSKIELYKENDNYLVKRTYKDGVYLKKFTSLTSARSDFKCQCMIAKTT